MYHKCITKIHDWIDVEGMLPQLMEHNVISGRDDMHRITHGSPRENLNYLYTKLCGCKNGFQLFYQCLRESQSDRLGHRDAADKLEETGVLYILLLCVLLSYQLKLTSPSLQLEILDPAKHISALCDSISLSDHPSNTHLVFGLINIEPVRCRYISRLELLQLQMLFGFSNTSWTSYIPP